MNINSINKYNNYKKHLSFLNKKNKLIIIDGSINYTINKTNLSCPCSKYLCEHIIYFLINIIGIDMDYLIFFNKLKEELIKHIFNKNDYSSICQQIKKLIDTEYECIICLCSLQETNFNKSIVLCSNCLNFCHKYCFDLYKSKNQLLIDTCIYCKSGNML